MKGFLISPSSNYTFQKLKLNVLNLVRSSSTWKEIGLDLNNEICVSIRLHSTNKGTNCRESSTLTGREHLPICDFGEVEAKNRCTNDNTNTIMKVLNVAEKNDAAKRIAALLSGGAAQFKNGPSKFNKLYEFPFQLMGRACTMVMTSVSGHLLNYEFDSSYRNWQSVDPVSLFEAPVYKRCPTTYVDCKTNLEKQAAYAQFLIIWTDCDREGENIGFEIIQVCKAINPRLTVYRAKFSEITPTAITRAVHNLIQPNKFVSDAVDTRSELDLRIGAAFTRFQTLRLQRKFPEVLSQHLISYGSCQFPTLGFVVERYKAIQEFIPEDFWKIEVAHTVEQASVDFHWSRVRLFNELACRALFERCKDNPLAKVCKVSSKPKSKWRPVAMDTIEFEKLASRKLKIGAKDAMKIAEKLYTAGNISYPRTETNIFPKGLDLVPLIQMQISNLVPWGGFAQRLIAQGPNPRNGKKSDQAHPPIHPTKFVSDLYGNEAKIYELIVRHFLACCSKDAVGRETTVEIEIAEEKFVANGLVILERNYLEVYPYDKWSDKELPNFEEGQTFVPTKIEMTESQTCPPSLLTEADLIALMEKHGIGTDATHADHIETIKLRMYVGVQNDGGFVPGQLGMGLVEGYDSMGFQMSKPHLRAQLEADLKRICDGVKTPDNVLREQVASYKAVFIDAMQQVNKLDEAISHFLNPNASASAFPGGNGGGPNGGSGGRGPRGDGSGGDGPSGGGPNGRGPGGGPSGGGPNGRGYPGSGPGRAGPEIGVPVGRGSMIPGGRGPYGNDSRGGSVRGHSTQTPSSAPLCLCGEQPALITVRKEGPNKGRLFYKCATCGFFEWYDDNDAAGDAAETISTNITLPASHPRFPVQNSNFDNNMPPPPARPRVQGGGMPNQSQPNYNNLRRPKPNEDFDDEDDDEGDSQIPLCNCGVRASSLTVKKDSENHGRHFFACAKGMQNSCGFFKWDDEGIGQQARPPPSERGRGRGRGQRGGAKGGQTRTVRSFSPSNDRSDKKQRRCGVCNELGHNRRICPTRDFEAEEQISMDGVW